MWVTRREYTIVAGSNGDAFMRTPLCDGQLPTSVVTFFRRNPVQQKQESLHDVQDNSKMHDRSLLFWLQQPCTPKSRQAAAADVWQPKELPGRVRIAAGSPFWREVSDTVLLRQSGDGNGDKGRLKGTVCRRGQTSTTEFSWPGRFFSVSGCLSRGRE